jgi:O-antigen ligase
MFQSQGDHAAPDRFATVSLWLLCFVAVSPSLGTAVAAIGRLVLYLLALAYLVWWAQRRTAAQQRVAAQRDATVQPVCAVVLWACAFMALSVLWSTVPSDAAGLAWTRHARLLTIPVIYYLIATSDRGLVVLRAFAFAQLFVVLTAWLLVVGIRAPWVTANSADTTYAVYGSYLEQSISQSVLAAILWFQRGVIFGPRGRWIAVAFAVSTLVLTLGFLQGRSGHLVALGMVSLACLHAMPKRWRWATLAVPFVAFAVLAGASDHFRKRMALVGHEVQAYAQTGATNSSSGERLAFWGASVQAIAQRPLLGSGAGSWNHEYLRIGGDGVPQPTADNPHQLFLLWAVEGGLVGLALLLAVLWRLWAFSKHQEPRDAHTLQAVVLALVISGMFNSMIFGIGMGDFFCVGLGILLAMHKRSSEANTQQS